MHKNILQQLKQRKIELEKEKQSIIKYLTSKWDDKTLDEFNNKFKSISEGTFDYCDEEEAKKYILDYYNYLFTPDEYFCLIDRIKDSYNQEITIY